MNVFVFYNEKGAVKRKKAGTVSATAPAFRRGENSYKVYNIYSVNSISALPIYL